MDRVDVKCGFLCNNRCIFCVQGEKRKTHGDISTATIFASLEEAREHCDSVVLTGGEVTIKDDFLAIVKRAASLDFSQIQVQTNGRMFSDEDFCRQTSDAGANEFSLALHGHTEALHDYLTRAPGSFMETARGIRNLARLGLRVGTNTVITRSNYRHLSELAHLLVHLGVSQYQFAFVHAVGEAGTNFANVVPRYSLIEPFVKKGLDVGIAAGIAVMTEAIPYCFMGQYERYVAEAIIPHTRIFDVNIIDDYTAYRVNEGKCRSEGCKLCKHLQICEGPWKEYPQHYGWAEFEPVV